jgi:histidinol-phosphatase
MTQSPFLATAIKAARAAELIINPHYQSEFEVRTKQDRSPVTVADLEAERVIHETLASAFPEHGFYGEESGRSDTASPYQWIVDPIDGTKSFVRRYPLFATQIALLHKGVPAVGVSNAAVYGELAWAERGQGAWLNGEQIRVSEVDTLEQCSLSVGNIVSLTQGPSWSAVGDLVRRVDRFRGYGDFFHYHLLAMGCIDVVIESDIHIYDVAALAVIVEEAGGTVTCLDGAPLTLDSTTVLATNGRLHELMLRSLG